jgi:hypothetical protein
VTATPAGGKGSWSVMAVALLGGAPVVAVTGAETAISTTCARSAWGDGLPNARRVVVRATSPAIGVAAPASSHRRQPDPGRKDEMIVYGVWVPTTRTLPTIAAAKRYCRARYSRLPRLGREVSVPAFRAQRREPRGRLLASVPLPGGRCSRSDRSVVQLSSVHGMNTCGPAREPTA